MSGICPMADTAHFRLPIWNKVLLKVVRAPSEVPVFGVPEFLSDAGLYSPYSIEWIFLIFETI